MKIFVMTMAVSVLCLAALLILQFIVGKLGWKTSLLKIATGGLAAGNLGLIIFLWINHLNFPLFLDLMEGTVLQHFERAVAFQPIYSEPAPEYVPLAYNVGYYIFSIPFGWLFGVNLFTLRFVSILGMLGTGVLCYLIVREKTDSAWWGLLTVGLYASAYRVMDAYLDTAHSDSWLVFSGLLGTYMLSRSDTKKGNLLAVLVLVSSFWFKQHGALFAVGGVLYLTLKEGWRSSIPYWITAAVFGPLVYLFAGPSLFGSFYLYFTWEVPSSWSSVGLSTLLRPAKFAVYNYFVLGVGAFLALLSNALKGLKQLSVWDVQLLVAGATALMGSLDAGSSDNVYIALGTFLIVTGVLGIQRIEKLVDSWGEVAAHALVLLSFGLFLYNPLTVIKPWSAENNYRDLVETLQELDGPVYAPTLGQLPADYQLFPAAHWVALDDMIRGPGTAPPNHPKVRKLLAPAIECEGPAYILGNYKLGVFPFLDFLNEHFELQEDYGDRFGPLRVLPARWDHGWPRYLYRRKARAEHSALISQNR